MIAKAKLNYKQNKEIFHFKRKKKQSFLTKSNKQVFSLNDPTHPANPIQNIKIPTSTNTNAGSKNNVPPIVKRPKLSNVSFSIHAYIPIAAIIKPRIFFFKKKTGDFKN